MSKKTISLASDVRKLRIPKFANDMLQAFYLAGLDEMRINKRKLLHCARCQKPAQFQWGCCSFHSFCSGCYVAVNATSKENLSCKLQIEREVVKKNRKTIAMLFHRRSSELIRKANFNFVLPYVNRDNPLPIRRPATISVLEHVESDEDPDHMIIN